MRVGEIVEELLEAKRQDGMSDRYILQLQSNLRCFAGLTFSPEPHIRNGSLGGGQIARHVALGRWQDLQLELVSMEA